MVKTSESQQPETASPRVYKSKDVHKRRAGRKERSPEGESVDVRQSDSQALDELAPSAEPSIDSRIEPGSPDHAADDSEVTAGQDVTEEAAQPKPSKLSDRIKLPQKSHEEPRDLEADDAAELNALEDTWFFDEGADERGSFDELPSRGKGAGSHEKKRSKKRRVRPRTVLVAFLLVVLIAIVGLSAAFAWDRWGRYDDHATMQGQWYVLGTTAPVTIDEHEIHLTDEISYEYEIDEHSKTISYTFGPMKGQGRYWFSGDRQFFAIIDGEGYTGATTAFEDIVRYFTVESGATGAKLPTGEGVVIFGREPGWFATITQEAAARAKERLNEQKAQEKAEAEARVAEARAKAEKEHEEAAKKREEEAKAAEAEEAEAYDPQYDVDEQQEYLDEEGVEGEDADTGTDEADEGAEPSDDAEAPEDADTGDDAETTQEANDAE